MVTVVENITSREYFALKCKSLNRRGDTFRFAERQDRAPLAVSELEAWRQRRTTNTIPNATTKEGPFRNTEQRKTCFLAPKLLAVPFDLVLSFVHELLIRVHYSSHTYQLSVVAKM